MWRRVGQIKVRWSRPLLSPPSSVAARVQDRPRRVWQAGVMPFDTKIAIAVREDLATWQKLNVTAFLASAVAGGRPEVIGERYQDGSGHVYLPMFRQPVLVYAADAQTLADAHGRALARELDTAVYIEDMFKTGHDADNRAAVRAVAAEEMALVGLAVYGPKNAVDKIFKGFMLHP
jgi:hypothetical protein